ncbi:hypothetical protein E2C01_076198 [Portunus trituberculatus]|uniref:Uncharacterized protein n=1 Tax=Portunus trituberculatus TaxID=210409 RepID=A0A5B7IGW3_PORTR|nr:hypothetical protein [Portunus trituberculatus]
MNRAVQGEARRGGNSEVVVMEVGWDGTVSECQHPRHADTGVSRHHTRHTLTRPSGVLYQSQKKNFCISDAYQCRVVFGGDVRTEVGGKRRRRTSEKLIVESWLEAVSEWDGCECGDVGKSCPRKHSASVTSLVVPDWSMWAVAASLQAASQHTVCPAGG